MLRRVQIKIQGKSDFDATVWEVNCSIQCEVIKKEFNEYLMSNHIVISIFKKYIGKLQFLRYKLYKYIYINNYHVQII